MGDVGVFDADGAVLGSVDWRVLYGREQEGWLCDQYG